ncbi:hypothetical protein ACFOY8_17795 [Thalassospira xianhensis]|uniref:Uncharacterized protein n=1 Tax=Thalassospira xianhensis MCCC 1A02616 TaxID=1177929 RepID=A0A367UG98_9PROT|nr:hypothetical protein [Thalassospira xianhensis]RCK07335.1 hypothetical protein TH5_02795 [Thalassospira xianhensis MCCC 1A02616]UKV13832.1 hypothetical protein L6172_17520 [Thalassospiraceae bacterium SW-3-3]
MGMLKETLLRVFVGKRGREALKAYSDAQSLQLNDPDMAVRTAAQAKQARRIEDRAMAYQESGMSFDEARAQALAETLTESSSDPQAAILKALEEADAKVGKKKSRMPTAADDQRAKLISEALSAMRNKQEDLDKLDPELRAKLTLMAVGALMGGPPTKQ